ncbi:MAG: flagellar protein FlaG [Synergistaceae bacterium]|jgi:uncharacterized FlaG/YvyC family protein|nr:flagellar protein FlaG [Synergistaceae bacterium]
MKVELPLGGSPYPNPWRSAASEPFAPQSASGALGAKASGDAAKPKEFEEGGNDPREMLERAVGLALGFDRNLKFEIIKDAGILQIQVIDSSDGRVVRKIPADEVVKWVAQIKNMLSDRINVLA